MQKDLKYIGGGLIGLMLAYFNLELSQIYIPFLSIKKEYRGYSLAKQMLDILKFHKEYSIICLEVEKTNKAFFFYQKNGFKIESDRGNKFLMKYTI